MREEVHVALVRRGAVQRDRSEETAAGLLEQHAHRDRAEAEAAVLARQLRTEDAGVSCFGAKRSNELGRERLRLRGDHFVAHECGDAVAEIDQFRLEREVHCRFSRIVAAP